MSTSAFPSKFDFPDTPNSGDSEPSIAFTISPINPLHPSGFTKLNGKYTSSSFPHTYTTKTENENWLPSLTTVRCDDSVVANIHWKTLSPTLFHFVDSVGSEMIPSNVLMRHDSGSNEPGSKKGAYQWEGNVLTLRGSGFEDRIVTLPDERQARWVIGRITCQLYTNNEARTLLAKFHRTRKEPKEGTLVIQIFPEATQGEAKQRKAVVEFILVTYLYLEKTRIDSL
ncbi:hypothetical protein DL96DRAFT_1564546 [Flagelloscypha sp. PMI_526]|nr:hypothetical protein DL96DRAFT_1564546 [Flagelloscypha sp. PMI_526]